MKKINLGIVEMCRNFFIQNYPNLLPTNTLFCLTFVKNDRPYPHNRCRVLSMQSEKKIHIILFTRGKVEFLYFKGGWKSRDAVPLAK